MAVTRQQSDDHFRLYITEDVLNNFKSLFPGHPVVSAVTLDQLLSYSQGKDPNGYNPQVNPEQPLLPPRAALTPCAMAWSGLALNIFSLITGLAGIRIPINEQMEVMVARMFDQVYIERTALKVAFDTIKDETASRPTKILAVLALGRTTIQGSAITAIAKAIFSSLTIWDGILYGALAIATITAAFATGGLSLIANAAITIVGLGLVISSIVAVHKACYSEVLQAVTTVAGGNGVGSAANQFNSPQGMFLDSNGDLYICDSYNSRIQKWALNATTGVTVAGGNDKGNAAYQFSNPSDIFVDAGKNIYVVDSGNNRVQKWAPGATSGITVAGGNGQGNGLNQFDVPFGMQLDFDGNIYVVDSRNFRVMKWAPGAVAGTVVISGTSGSGLDQFYTVYFLALNFGQGTTVQGIYLNDCNNYRVTYWPNGATAGTIVMGQDGMGTGPRQFNYPYGLKLANNGDLFVCDSFNARVQRLNAQTQAVDTVAGGNGSGTAQNQLDSPYEVTVDKDGNLYIIDYQNARIQKWFI